MTVNVAGAHHSETYSPSPLTFTPEYYLSSGSNDTDCVEVLPVPMKYHRKNDKAAKVEAISPPIHRSPAEAWSAPSPSPGSHRIIPATIAMVVMRMNVTARQPLLLPFQALPLCIRKCSALVISRPNWQWTPLPNNNAHVGLQVKGRTG